MEPNADKAEPPFRNPVHTRTVHCIDGCASAEPLEVTVCDNEPGCTPHAVISLAGEDSGVIVSKQTAPDLHKIIGAWIAAPEAN